MKMLKKSQAAMEFLMTYGWAILVVLVSISALAYFGVLSPDKFLPGKCYLPPGIACIDHNIDAKANSVTVVLRNGIGFDVDGVVAAVSGCPASVAQTMPNGADNKKIVLIGCTGLTTGSRFNGDLNVTYRNIDTDLTRTVKGSISGRAQ
ncbi:hypothetical protein HYX01_04885 [Candidatus Woesearchaeota archaeon]|nr:hypothetical protein [Candidatus Woesearchaeota archaeon]